jgi:hypothetical protein
MARLLLVLGLVALAVGLLWVGQGLGVIAWPQSSFMINQIEWAGYGAALAALGLILIWQSQP